MYCTIQKHMVWVTTAESHDGYSNTVGVFREPQLNMYMRKEKMQFISCCSVEQKLVSFF